MKILIVSAIAISALLYLIRKHQQMEKARIESKKQLAKKLNCEFYEEPKAMYWEQYALAHFFSEYQNSTVKEMLISQGEEKYSFFVQEYKIYNSRTDHHSSTYRQTIVVLHASDWLKVDFELRPESILHKLGTLIGMQDIDFDELPEFSRKYLLQARKVAWVKKTFNKTLLDMILKEHPVCIESWGGKLFFWYMQKELVEEETLELLAFARQFAVALQRTLERKALFG